MASRRWVITTPEPHTAACQGCGARKNKLAVYRTESGRLCRTCISSPVVASAPAMAARAAATSPKGPKTSVPMVKPARPTVCPEPDCARLPAHHGDHRPTLHRRPKVVAGAYSYGA